MNNFGIGLIFGIFTGTVVSLLQDKNGKRLGEPIKREYDAFKQDTTELIASAKKAHQAQTNLSKKLPLAERAISDINNDISSYQRNIALNIDNINKETQKINQHFSNDSKKK